VSRDMKEIWFNSCTCSTSWMQHVLAYGFLHSEVYDFVATEQFKVTKRAHFRRRCAREKCAHVIR